MITCALGKQGSGKSTLALLFARLIQQLDQSILIYTNMSASGSGIVKINDLGEIPFDRTPKILLVDEAMFSVDSRNSSSKSNQEWTRAVAFFRKSNFVFVCYMTHDISMIDVRLRFQMEYIFMCRKTPEYNEHLIIDTTSYQAVPFRVPKTTQLFDFVDFDTYDFPMPISTVILSRVMPMISAK